MSGRELEIGEPRRDGLEVAARIAVGNDAHRIFIRASGGPVAPAGEAFLAVALLPAMVLGADVRVAGPISPRLVAALPKIQELFHGWASWYQLVRVEAESRRTPARSRDARVGCFFSGGLDSLYTVLKRHREISELIFVHGFDVSLEDLDLRARVVQPLRKAAAELGKPLLEVETNLRSFSDAHVDWGWAHLVGQAAVAHVLAPRFSKILIPSTHPDVYHSNGSPASGSHPLLPALWSSNDVELTHDGGEVGRVAKAAVIADHDIALETLRVCWWNPDGAYNCARCEKCLTTMINMYAVGALDRCVTFPRQLTLRAVASLTLPSDSARFFMAENLSALEETGRDPELAAVIRSSLERRARAEA